jgi:hypothetical protein
LFFIIFSQFWLPHLYSKFLKEWGKKLDSKRDSEREHEKSTRSKAGEDLSNWKQQREIRLNAKKDSNRSEEQVLLETLESEAEVLKVGCWLIHS